MIVASGSVVAAQEQPVDAGDVLWLVDEPDAEGVDELLAGIDEALAADGADHLVGHQDLRGRVPEQITSLPQCVMGVEPCGSAEAIAFDALGVGLLIRLHIDRADTQFEVNYEMVDRRGEPADSGRIAADDLRRAGFELVRQLFDAVGVVTIESTPSPASVIVDGETVGETPLSEQLGVGTYDFVVQRNGYADHRGIFEVRGGQPQRVVVELKRRPGGLRVVGAPEEATVVVDDEPRGAAHEVIELEAGRRAIEVRADEYQPYRTTAELEAGGVTELEVDLRRQAALLRDIETDAIADHRLQLDVGVQIGGQMAAFEGARGRVEDDERVVEFGGWLDDGEPVAFDEARQFVSPVGVRLGVNWEGKWFGLGLLNLSFGGRTVDRPMRLVGSVDGDDQEATVVRMRSLQIRPMQARARFFYENLAPYAQAGVGVGIEWLDVRIDERREVDLRRIVPLGNAEVGVRYHFDPRWSVGGSYRLQGMFGVASGLEHTVGLTFGFGVRELPSLEPQPPGEL